MHPLAIDMKILSHFIDNLNATCTSSLLSSSSVKKGTAKLLPKTKAMLCNAASVDGMNLQPDLPTSLQSFLGQSTIANVLEHICDQLLQRNCICGIASSVLTAMHMGHFIWTTPDVLTNFTIFALPQKKADALDVVGLVVKAAERTDLDVSDTKSLTKLHLQVPTPLNLAHHMLNNLAVLCAKITGNTSLLTLSIYSWVAFFNKNKEHITHLGAKDHKFYTKVLYSVDTAKEAYLQTCCKGNIDATLINFNSTKTQILSCQYFIFLPPVLKALTSTLNQSIPLDLSHLNPPMKPTQVTKKYGNKTWLVPRSEYKNLIHNNIINGHVQLQI
eukprot:15356886-Ditylum_brightwellii.AAC.2